MKKIFLPISILFALNACKKDRIEPIAAEPVVTKTIVYSIAAVADYTQPYYNNASAEIKLTLAKQLQNPYREVTIWDTTFLRRPLALYMQINPNLITKTITGIKDSEDKIAVGYSISYITGPLNAQQFSAYGAVIESGNSTHRVPVSL